MAHSTGPESAINSNEGRVNNALSARRKPPRLVWSEERGKRKKTNLGFSDFPHYALECRNIGMPGQRKREREREVATRKPWDERLKCGRKGGVIRGSLPLISPSNELYAEVRRCAKTT